MRVPFDTIKEYGVRLTPYSKFYIYNDMIFEPLYRAGKVCKNYKAIKEPWRVRELLRSAKEKIPKVSEIDPDFPVEKLRKYTKKKEANRFELMDLE